MPVTVLLAPTARVVMAELAGAAVMVRMVLMV
jgi:hypothetical protein